LRKHFYFFAISGALAVILGAFSSHYLKSLVKSGILEPESLDSFKTGVLYHFLHTLLLGLILIINKENRFKFLKSSVIFLEWGIIFFSGSIYLLTLGKLLSWKFLNILGPITPVGGLLFILSWVMLFLHFRTEFGRDIEK
jgi:uncharacterized membrane protein YgdD (TMEM256/DUF423 family)